MYTLIKVAYAFILPPGLFVTALVAFAIVLRSRLRQRRVASATIALAVAFYLLSTGVVGHWLTKQVIADYEAAPTNPRGDVIVVLGEGASKTGRDVTGQLGQESAATENNLITAVKLYRRLHVPIVVSGGQPFVSAGNEAIIGRRELINFGIPASSVFIDPTSRDTLENAQHVARLVRQHRWHHPILIASASHMKRSVTYFAKFDMLVIPYPTNIPAPSSFSYTDFMNYLPTVAGLSTTAAALKEDLGLMA